MLDWWDFTGSARSRELAYPLGVLMYYLTGTIEDVQLGVASENPRRIVTLE